MNCVTITRHMLGICHMQVCAEESATDEEILSVCNSENPSGTTNGWSRVVREGEEIMKPVTCSEHPTRKHFLVVC